MTKGHILIAYNALFDRRAFHRTDTKWGLPKFDWKGWGSWWCAMYASADLLCLERLKWFKLVVVAKKLGVGVDDIILHSSLGDTILALRVTNFLIEFSKGGKEII